MEWTVVTVIIALVGLFMTVGKPIIALNGSITHLQDAIDELREDIRADARTWKINKKRNALPRVKKKVVRI